MTLCVFFFFNFESSMLASWRSLPSYSNPDYVVNNDIRHWWNHWLLVSDNQRHWLQHFTLLMMMAMMMMATMMMATMPRPKLEVYRHFLDWKTNTVSSPADVTAWWWWWWFFMSIPMEQRGTRQSNTNTMQILYLTLHKGILIPHHTHTHMHETNFTLGLI